jgi:hypothetical protein|tara:strand:- start:105 stop:569 length:465 start_codon:yes stop_codon:yes gene_type:complete
MGRFVKNPEATQGQTLEIPSVTTANRPAGQNGQIIFNTTTSTYQVYNGAAWYNVSEASREKTLVVDRFQGDGSTTVFGNGSGNTLDGSTAASLSVTPDAATDMLIFVGGVAQVAGTNYTYSGGAVTFGSAPPANDGTTNGHVIAIIHNLQKLGE